jgi:hypothetical protein
MLAIPPPIRTMLSVRGVRNERGRRARRSWRDRLRIARADGGDGHGSVCVQAL